MNRNNVIERLTEVFRDVFDDHSIIISERTTSEDIEDLVEAVEDEFKLRFKMKEVSGMKNVGEMIDIICERGKR